MIFTKEDVKDTCIKLTPLHNLDWKLVYAICLNEGQKDKNNFDPSVARLEQGFYRRYTEPMKYATTTEILLAASYGVMQMLGESLRAVGFLQWYFNQCSDNKRKLLNNALSQFAVVNAIDKYCVKLNWQIIWGCKWFNRKLELAEGDIKTALGLWNGDRSGAYANKILRTKNSL